MKRLIIFTVLFLILVSFVIVNAFEITKFDVKPIITVLQFDCSNDYVEMNMFVKIYNPKNASFRVSIFFLDEDGFVLGDHQRSSNIFPEFFSQSGDTTIFWDTHKLSGEIYQQYAKHRVVVSSGKSFMPTR